MTTTTQPGQNTQTPFFNGFPGQQFNAFPGAFQPNWSPAFHGGTPIQGFGGFPGAFPGYIPTPFNQSPISQPWNTGNVWNSTPYASQFPWNGTNPTQWNPGVTPSGFVPFQYQGQNFLGNPFAFVGGGQPTQPFGINPNTFWNTPNFIQGWNTPSWNGITQPQAGIGFQNFQNFLNQPFGFSGNTFPGFPQNGFSTPFNWNQPSFNSNWTGSNWPNFGTGFNNIGSIPGFTNPGVPFNFGGISSFFNGGVPTPGVWQNYAGFPVPAWPTQGNNTPVQNTGNVPVNNNCGQNIGLNREAA